MFALKSDDGFEVLVGILRKQPEKLFVTEKFMAIWLPDFDKTIIILGDYRKYSEEEVDRIFGEKIVKFLEAVKEEES
ncbi:MAG: hypothetical protein ABWY25_07660 [Paenisporosarcina sp.]